MAQVYATNEGGNASKIKGSRATVATLGAGVGALIEVGKLRMKINKKYAKMCAEADAKGLPHPPKPDTSTKTLLAVISGAVKGSVVGYGATFIPGVGRALQDLGTTVQGTSNKLLGGSKVGIKEFSFINTFLHNTDFSERTNYTLEFLSDQDFADIDLNNLDIGIVTPTDVLKCFFSMARIAGNSLTKEDLVQYFSKKNKQPAKTEENPELVKNNPLAEKDRAILGLNNVAMPVLGAIAGGLYGGWKGRKRALQKWEHDCKIAAAKGKPLPPKPSILLAAGDVAKNAAVGGGIGYVGSKLLPGVNTFISRKGDDYLTSSKSYNKFKKSADKNGQIIEWQNKLNALENKGTQNLNWLEMQEYNQLTQLLKQKENQLQAQITFSDYRAALARKGQYTTLTEEEFYSCPPEYYDILARNMAPVNFNVIDSGKDLISKGKDKVIEGKDKVMGMKTADLIMAGTATGLGLGLIKSAIESGKSYEQYKVDCEANGETPISKVQYIAMLKGSDTRKNLYKGASSGMAAGVWLSVGRNLYNENKKVKEV